MDSASSTDQAARLVCARRQLFVLKRRGLRREAAHAWFISDRMV